MKSGTLQSPISITLQRSKWDNLDFFIPNYFQRDFCHDDLLTLKLKTLTRQFTSIKLVRRFRQASCSDKVKIWMQLRKPDTYLYLHYIDEKIKILYDHGIRYLGRTPFNIYGSVDFRRDGKDPNIKLGLNYIGEHLHFKNRLKLGPHYNAVLYTRFLSYFYEVQMGAQSVVDLRTNQFLKKDVFMWYSVGEFTFQFKYIQDWDQPSGFQDLSKVFNRAFTTILYQSGLSLYGFEVQIWRKERKWHELISGMVDYVIDQNNRLKIKIDDRCICTVLYERRPTDRVKLSLGSQIPFMGSQKFKIGCKLTLNV